ncbi:MAG: NAD-dependent epimerase/dehydratase family protein [Gammaproteobacteria bacterium]|nr:MAG: NAD-dependent epimerase/dehydratase family protein [Gammaproteobacteria bacterium]|tara:strand:- start:61 stop:183 length:123 start_codon:yes stop_codon:yes gene_type:complete
MTILVTGNAGYKGSHFVRFLEKKNSDFEAANNLSTENKKI